jgi:hypothetical protein
MSIKSLNCFLALVCQKTTLQTVLMGVFGLKILATGGVIGGVALFTAKRQGKNQVVLYREEGDGLD